MLDFSILYSENSMQVSIFKAPNRDCGSFDIVVHNLNIVKMW